MLTTCSFCNNMTSAFVAPCMPSFSPFSSFTPITTSYRPRVRMLSTRIQPRRIQMTKASPDDIPSEQPDPADNLIDMDLLKKRISDVDRKPHDNFRPSDAVIDLSAFAESDMDAEHAEEREYRKKFANVSALWVIVFTNVTDGSEGVYSLSLANESIVLAFEQREEAQRYALGLEAQEFPSPQFCQLEIEELKQFCKDSGLRLGFVPSGSLMSPPDESAIDDLDKWRGKPTTREAKDNTGLSEDDIETMKKRLDKLFGI